MVYAYDLGLQLPIGSVYDTQMMLAHVAAAKDMYEKAAQEMKDFLKEYGDFYSPILRDMDWYADNVTGRMLNKINELYARGIDPLRSMEGRLELRLEMYKINPGEVSLLKQSAANAIEFQKAKRQLLLQGLYNPIYNAQEEDDLSTYSTLGPNGKGIWNKTALTPIRNISEFGNPYFEGMKPNVHRVSKNGVEYSVESITMDDLKRIADSKFNDLVNTPQGRLMYNYYRNLTGNDAEAREMFNNVIAAGQDRRTYTKDDYEDNYFKQQSLALQRASHNLEVQKFNLDKLNADRDFLLKLSKEGITIDPTTGKFIAAGEAGGYVQPMDQRKIDKAVHSRSDALSNYQQLFIDAIRNDQAIIDKYNKEKTASTLGYTEESVSGTIGPNPVIGPMMYVPSKTKRTKYIKDKNSEEQLAKMKKEADVAALRIKAYKHLMNSGPEELIKYRYLDESGIPTKQYTKLVAKTYLNKDRLNGLSESLKKETIHGLFNSLYSAGDLVEGEFFNWRSKLFAGGNLEKLPGTKDKKLIATSTGGYRYAPVYESHSLGVRMPSNSMEVRLDNWLQNNKPAWVWDDALAKDYFSPSKSGEKYSISNNIVISQQDLEDFAKQYGYSIDLVIKNLLLRTHVYKNDIGNAISAQYYEIPVYKDFQNNGGFNYYRVNEQINKGSFGSSQSTKDREDALRQSVMN